MKITRIGTIAQELLEREPAGQVWGSTSRGLFLRLGSEWVVFISTESDPGPLTLNFSGDGYALRQAQNSDPVAFRPGWIVFPASGARISTRQARPWRPPAPPAIILPHPQRKAQLEAVIQQLSTRHKPTRGDSAEGQKGPRPTPSSMLNALLPIQPGFEGSTQEAISALLTGLQGALRQQQTTAIAAALQPLLGRGSGLTPSGDDLTIGLLLALNRWGAQVSPGLQAAELNLAVVPYARRQTTLLSACLIECAAFGQADERLLLALDGILTGEPGPHACASLLAAWGNTSGMDALAGMALALSLL
jgi:hypothetical protein